MAPEVTDLLSVVSVHPSTLGQVHHLTVAVMAVTAAAGTMDDVPLSIHDAELPLTMAVAATDLQTPAATMATMGGTPEATAAVVVAVAPGATHTLTPAFHHTYYQLLRPNLTARIIPCYKVTNNIPRGGTTYRPHSTRISFRSC